MIQDRAYDRIETEVQQATYDKVENSIQECVKYPSARS